MRYARMAGCIALAVMLSLPAAQACVPYPMDWLLKSIIPMMKERESVIDAGLAQDGCTLSLAVIVVTGTGKVEAKKQVDSFVRMVKTFGPRPSPGKVIGSGVYDMLIGAFLPGREEPLVLGAEASFAHRIIW